jgi:hypothetical protein
MATLKPDQNVVEYLDGISASRETGGHRRLNSASVRLCNNHLVTLKGLDKVLYHVLDDPSELVWLDASCNSLLTIEEIITAFPKLQVNPLLRCLATNKGARGRDIASAQMQNKCRRWHDLGSFERSIDHGMLT